ncbi:MAG: hypothetical protein JJU11_17775 [Candidatus Sumerlaeia bacterium]|nr:hypothetical protein [Candidatus Sumerlaeia bacterium]
MKFKGSIQSGGVLLGIMLLGQGVVLADEEGPAIQIEELIPASAWTALWVDDMGGMKERFEANPYFAALLEDEGIEEGWDLIREAVLGLPHTLTDPHDTALTNFLNTIDINSEQGEENTRILDFSSSDITETFSGLILNYSTWINFRVVDGFNIPVNDDVLVAAYSEEEREKVEAFLEGMLVNTPGNATRRTLEYHDEEVFQIQYNYVDREGFSDLLPQHQEAFGDLEVTIEYTFMDGYFLLAYGDGSPLATAIGTLKGLDGYPTLANSGDYRRLVQAHDNPNADLKFYLNWEVLLGSLPKDNDEDIEELLKIIGLHGSGPLLFDMLVDETEMRAGTTIMTSRENPGFLGLLRSFSNNELDGLRLVPSDAPTYMSLSIDMGAFYDFVMEVAQATSPEVSGGIQIGLAVAQSQLGVNIVDDVIRQIAGEVVAYDRQAIDAMEGLEPEWSFGLVIPFQGTMETISRLNDGIRNYVDQDASLFKATSEDVEGVTLWELKPGLIPAEETVKFFFAITPTGIFSGPSGLEVREMMRAGQGDGAGTDIRQGSDLRSILQGIDHDQLIGISFLNGRAFVDEYIRTANAHDIEGARPESRMRRTIGNSWWLLHGSDNAVTVTYTMKAP